MKSAETRADEKFALELLRKHLSEHGDSEYRCEVKANDPPDLIVIWENGDKWGVEVTQTHQHVASIDGSRIVSSEHVLVLLRRFAQELGRTTENIRKRDYFLGLGSDPLSLQQEMIPRFDRKWQKETEEAIRRHMLSEEGCILRLPGAWLKPGEPGNDWRFTASPGVAEIPSTTEAMLWRAFRDKTEGLSRWNGDFDQRWLLLLNCYPLASDIDDMKEALREFADWWEESARFDGVFWSGYPDRTLIPISLPESF